MRLLKKLIAMLFNGSLQSTNRDSMLLAVVKKENICSHKAVAMTILHPFPLMEQRMNVFARHDVICLANIGGEDELGQHKWFFLC